MAVAAGTSSGPMLSGVLFQIGGYWVAWSSAFGILLIDIVLRLLMIEKSRLRSPTSEISYHSKSSNHASHESFLTLAYNRLR
jgi:MFS family permease